MKTNSKPAMGRTTAAGLAAESALRPATPRVDAVEYASAKVRPSRMAVDANFARQLEMELSLMFDFINREMKMTASDVRIADLERRIAALNP